MDENTTKMIKERFDALPEMIQNLILSSHYQDTLIEIGKKYQLNVEQLGLLEQETTLVMMGLTPTDSFETELTQELSVDKMKGNQIVTEINEKIFLTIRDLLKLMYTPAGEEPSVEEETEQSEISPDKGRQEGLNLETRDELLEKIENPEKTPPIRNDEGSQRPPVSNGTGSILEQKLSGSFSFPKVETDHSLNNISKNIDPYREIPE